MSWGLKIQQIEFPSWQNFLVPISYARSNLIYWLNSNTALAWRWYHKMLDCTKLARISDCCYLLVARIQPTVWEVQDWVVLSWRHNTICTRYSRILEDSNNLSIYWSVNYVCNRPNLPTGPQLLTRGRKAIWSSHRIKSNRIPSDQILIFCSNFLEGEINVRMY